MLITYSVNQVYSLCAFEYLKLIFDNHNSWSMNSQIRRYEAIAVRRRKFAARLRYTEDKQGVRNNPNKKYFNDVLSKVVAKFDPQLSVNNFDKFVVEQFSEFNSFIGNAVPDVGNSTISPESINVNQTTSLTEDRSSTIQPIPSPLSLYEDRSHKADVAPTLVNVDELSIVTPNLEDDVGDTDAKQTVQEISDTAKIGFQGKTYKSIAMENATTLGEYVVAKYAKYEKQYKKKRFHINSKQMVHFRKLRNPCYRKYLAVKYPHLVNINFHKYSSIRRSYVVNPSRNKFKDLSQTQTYLYKRWKKKKLPKMQHNSELLRELTLHWAKIQDKHLEVHDAKLPDLTVKAVDTIATAVQVYIRDEVMKIGSQTSK